MTTILKGNIVSVPALGTLDITEHGYLAAEDGVIAGVFQELPPQYQNAEVEDWGDCLILQSLADMHLHAPQYAMMAMGLELPLLEWLETYAFPVEARFADVGWAREVSQRLAHDLIACGTTRVCMYSSLHRESTLVLMEELEKAGLVGCVGKVNMDRGGGETLQETTEESQRETLRWLDECGRFEHIKPILTPRYTPACTDELMEFLGKLAAERDLPIQSHLSESLAEMSLVRRLHPDCKQYWETYAKFGLWNRKTLMAHCVHSGSMERKAIKSAGVTVVHCPNSNNAICSGVAPVWSMLNEGMQVALGTDVAGGSTLSMFDAVADALRASKARHVLDSWWSDFLPVTDAWYLGTSAGAAWFGDAPGFTAGAPLHALALDDGKLLQPHPMSVKERFERCVYLRQPHAIRAVWSAGRRVK